MSLDLYVCMLDLEKFRAVLGSGDRNLLRRITRQLRAEIESYDAYFLGSEPGAQPLAVVIAQIIDGKLDPSTPRFQFEGAAVMIADALGELLPVETLREASGAFCDEVDYLIAFLRDVNGIAPKTLPTIGEILERGPLLKIPLDPKMRLGSGYLTTREVTRAHSAIMCLDLDQPV